MNKVEDNYPLVEFQTDLVYAIGLVDFPATESNWLAFDNKEPEMLQFSVNSERQEILGAAMIPHKKIFRVNPMTNKPYYGFFTIDDIRQAAQNFSLAGNQQNLNINHTDEDAKSYVFQSYIVEEYHIEGLNKIGLDVPVGSWVIGVKIPDASTWAKVKAGEINGFSIEGLITLKDVVEEELDMELFNAMETYNELLNRFQNSIK